MTPMHGLLFASIFVACIFGGRLVHGLLNNIAAAGSPDERVAAVLVAAVLGGVAAFGLIGVWIVAFLPAFQLRWRRDDFEDDPAVLPRLDAAVERYRADVEARQSDRLDVLLDEFLVATKRVGR